MKKLAETGPAVPLQVLGAAIERGDESLEKAGGPKYHDIKVRLSGKNGNAFAVMGEVTHALKRAKVPTEDIKAFRTECLSGDYDHLLQTCMLLGGRVMSKKEKPDTPGTKGVGNLHGPNTLFMSVYCGEATDGDGNKFTLAATLGGNPVISHDVPGDDRRSWSLTWRQLLELAIANGILDKTIKVT